MTQWERRETPVTGYCAARVAAEKVDNRAG